MTQDDADQVRDFENRRWANQSQTPVWRHTVAVELVGAEPVLDVGGGDGLLLRMLGERGFSDIRLSDISPVAVDQARAQGFVADVGDVLAGLPYGSDEFATVCALDVLEHLLDPVIVLRELARIGREVVIATPNFSHLRARLAVATGRVPFQNKPARGHSYWMNHQVLIQLFDDAGLRPLEWRFEPSSRLGAAGQRLADFRPNLFAVAFAVRLVKA
jgi:2-polyprenyl-3-methyl-5-hydroxy-6-metoxy-1,4-benzoquinol methylase